MENQHVIGFDFGTTNSLMSLVLPIDETSQQSFTQPKSNKSDFQVEIFTDNGQPFPSVVKYEGERIIVGREARQQLDQAGLGVIGDTIRSPKTLLGETFISVNGVERNPKDIVSDVVKFVREASAQQAPKFADSFNQAVVTIPVNMNGQRRRDLREACESAGLEVIQFVHEPLAALYGYFRGSDDYENLVREFENRYLLVVDWGGGTLDLTLCKLAQGRLWQIRNSGTSEVGGDQFDQILRNFAIKEFIKKENLPESTRINKTSSLKLLQRCETVKIDLSTNQSRTLFVPNFLIDPEIPLELEITRDELATLVNPLINSGFKLIEELLDSHHISPMQISMCLAVGGMASVPTIQTKLREIFGLTKVVIPENSHTLVAEGAAWVAFDKQPLELAKALLAETARGNLTEILATLLTMPRSGVVQHETDFFCSDPSSGLVKFSIYSPGSLPIEHNVNFPAKSVVEMTLKVNQGAKPLTERLKLISKIDHDLILSLEAKATIPQETGSEPDSISTQVFDLEFALRLPKLSEFSNPEMHLNVELPESPANVLVRGNLSATSSDLTTLPGDVLQSHHPRSFQRMQGEYQATPEQRDEALSYKPCSKCDRNWGDPECLCTRKT